MLIIPQKKHPSPWYNIHDVSRGSMSYWWIFISFGTFIPAAPNALFSVKFVGRSKYCLEIPKLKLGTERPVPISSIFSFKIVERAHENRNRGDLLTAGEYWESLFYFIFFTDLPTIFRSWLFQFFFTRIKRLLLKKVFLKCLYKKNVH